MIKEKIIDFYHMVKEYVEFKIEKNMIIDFAGDTPEEIRESHRRWVESNRFRRRDRDARKQLSSD